MSNIFGDRFTANLHFAHGALCREFQPVDWEWHTKLGRKSSAISGKQIVDQQVSQAQLATREKEIEKQ